MTCALEGTRPLLLEIQSLVSPTDLAMPRRVGTGVDPKRLAMIVAVLSPARRASARRRRRLRQRRGRRPDRRAGRRPRDRARDRVGGARRRRCANGWPRSARSASPAGCDRPRRPPRRLEECRKLGARCGARAGRDGRARPLEAGTLRAGARAPRSARSRSEQGFSRKTPEPENPCKSGCFAAFLVSWLSSPVAALGRRRFRRHGRGSGACTRSATRWCIRTTVQARS